MDTYQLRLRWMSILLGGIILFWLPVEDQNFIAAIFFSIAICLLGAFAFVLRKTPKSRSYVWIGLMAGSGVGLVSFLLMVFKIGLHSHNSPDFSLSQLFQLIEITPIWGIVGSLVGGGIYVYQVSRST